MERTTRGRKSTAQALVSLRRARIAHMLERGYTPYQMCEELGVSTGMISHYVAELEAEWRAQAEKTLSTIKAQRLAELAAVKREAWESWDLSTGRERINPEAIFADDGLEHIVESPATPTEPLLLPGDIPIEGTLNLPPVNLPAIVGHGREGPSGLDELEEPEDAAVAEVLAAVKEAMRAKRPGDGAYLKLVLDAIKAEREVLGLDAPKRSIELQITEADIRRMSTDQLEKLAAQLGKRDSSSINIDVEEYKVS